MRHDDDRRELRPGDHCYPNRLLDLPHPPAVVYLRGNAEVLSAPSLAVIGSRHPTPYGLAVAEMVAVAAARAGVAVVSGGAIGCDQAAGNAALQAGGRHVVVLGTGADVIYPPSAAGLIDRTLALGGAVVSLERWGSPPRRYAFPKRNVIIAGLAQATCVTEAGMPSGTFSTAEAADRIGREILAAPGSILSPQSRGSNYLISNGATILADEESVEIALSRIFGVLRLNMPASNAHHKALDPRDRLIEALAASPLRADEACYLIGTDTVASLELLSSLQVDGVIERLLDGRYSLTKRALHARSAIMHNG